MIEPDDDVFDPIFSRFGGIHKSCEIDGSKIKYRRCYQDENEEWVPDMSDSGLVEDINS